MGLICEILALVGKMLTFVHYRFYLQRGHRNRVHLVAGELARVRGLVVRGMRVSVLSPS